MRKFLRILLCASFAAFITLSGCSGEGESSAVRETTQAATEAPTTAAPTAIATNDSADAKEYNFVAIKQKSDEISNRFDQLISEKKFRGSIYMKLGNDFEYLSTTGAADANKHLDNSINTCFYTGSVTKQITAAAVLLLAEEGKLSLDETVDSFFPDYLYGKDITVKNLLTMTSGIKNYTVKSPVNDTVEHFNGELNDKISKDNSKEENKEMILEWILHQDLDFEPGTSFRFSDSSYYLLGEVIEKASGVPYESYVEEEILQPLGMSNSGFEKSDKLAVPYDGGSLSADIEFEGAGYSSMGFISNITDLLKWTDSLLGNQLLSKESLKEMLTANDYGYGYGVYVSKGRASVSDSCGAYGSMLSYTTDKSEIYIALTNYYYSDPSYLHGLFKQYLSAFSA